MSSLILPHGGELKDRFLNEAELEVYQDKLQKMPSWYLTDRQLCDMKLLLNGGFSPLDGFMTQQDYQSVLSDMRLEDGTLWPMPINLDVSEEFAESITVGDAIALRNPEGLLLGIMDVSDCWQPDKAVEAESVFATTDETHPAVFYLNHYAGPIYLGGKVHGVQYPKAYDFTELRNTPRELRHYLSTIGAEKIVGFQTRNPMHKAHYELTCRAAKSLDAKLLLHPVVGMTKPGDVDHYTRVKCYKEILAYYPEGLATLSLLPLAMRMGGPREALWHAIIRKNYGCTHFIVGRDHAGPGKNKQGEPFYGPYDAQKLVSAHQDELGIQMVPFQEMIYSKRTQNYIAVNDAETDDEILRISGTEFRKRLQAGMDIPEWFSFSEVISVLRRRYPPRRQQGFTVLFTGLSGAGKSTIANILRIKLMENTGRPITLLDGDLVRQHLSKGLGFSKEDRDTNIKRIGYVASEITKNRGIAICAPIAPYADTRRYIREMINQYGGFIEVYLSTSLETCEKRDPKGLYQKARAGIIKDFTGIDDPYEAPDKPELQIDTAKMSALDAAHTVYNTLVNMGYIDAIQPTALNQDINTIVSATGKLTES